LASTETNLAVKKTAAKTTTKVTKKALTPLQKYMAKRKMWAAAT
jgi:hypothetical protein